MGISISKHVQAKIEKKGWTVLLYMEPGTALSPWAIKNVNDMALVGSNDNLNILVEWHTTENTSWRYKIEHNTIIQKEFITMTHDCKIDIPNSMKWAVSNYPAEHYALVIWNHGFGILDPKPENNSKSEFNWVAEPDVKIEGQEAIASCQTNQCPIPLRGVLFNEITNTYMTNQKMVETFKIIKNDILNGQKIDIAGFDVCKMAMVEVGYQLKNYVNILIGSQNCELQDGWDYSGVFARIKDKKPTPQKFAQAIIDSYQEYYTFKTKENIFTQSAIDLSYMDNLINNLNKIVDLCAQWNSVNSVECQKILRKARVNSLQMCDASFYIDLDSFLTELNKNLKSQDSLALQDDEKETLSTLIFEGKEIIKNSVIATATGEKMKRCKGISIYFPSFHIDSSYPKTLFAQETKWLSFLRNTLNLN